MPFTDRVLICVECKREFTFTTGEQYFFRDKQFQHDPKRCKSCRALQPGAPKLRTETRAICAECGEETTLPFLPTQGRAVYCRLCFKRQLRTAAPIGGVAHEARPETMGRVA